MSKVIVTGGGAAGMLAAIAAAERGHSVVLLEKNEKLGKKIYITGKGRCNVTNACDFDTFLQNVTVNRRFLYSSLRGFFNTDICALLEEGGCPLKTERGERVFPVSDHASDVTKALLQLLLRGGVDIRLKTEVTGIEKRKDGGFLVHAKKAGKAEVRACNSDGSRTTHKTERSGSGAVKAETGTGRMRSDGKPEALSADAVIVCTGGLSYPTTGSTGDGYRFAEEFALKQVKPCPSLVPLTVSENDYRELQGLSLKNVSVSAASLYAPDKAVFEDFGELLFTHFGLSGPLILSASALLARRLSDGEKFVLRIDLKPALNEEKLDERILRDFEAAKNMDLVNALGKLLPSALRPVILRRAGLSPVKKVHDVTRAERQRLLSAVKAFSFTVTGTRGFSEAVITKGGVDVSEINPKTMEAKKVPGLYFAGEVLDIDALTGGFNLQLAWSTGYAAGRYAGERCVK